MVHLLKCKCVTQCTFKIAQVITCLSDLNINEGQKRLFQPQVMAQWKKEFRKPHCSLREGRKTIDEDETVSICYLRFLQKRFFNPAWGKTSLQNSPGKNRRIVHPRFLSSITRERTNFNRKTGVLVTKKK